MVTESFIVKVSKTRNRKNKDYYIFRVNVPNSIAKELNLDNGDYLTLQAKKSEWYELIDWSQMKKTWELLPNDIKEKIKNQNELNEIVPNTMKRDDILQSLQTLEEMVKNYPEIIDPKPKLQEKYLIDDV